MKSFILLCLALAGAVLPSFAASVYLQRIDDPQAVYLTAREFGIHADGATDDTEESPAQDSAVNVYLATGQINIYNPAGRLTNVIKAPEQPTHLVFSGSDHRTSFIRSHTSLYSVRVKVPGL